MITLLERPAAPPVILKDGAIYDVDANRFLADLPTNGVRSRHSLRSYGYDITLWARFLDVRGKTLWQATRTDVDSYHRARRYDGAAHRISAASWNRAVAALDKLYRWAVDERLVAHSPFAYRDVWRRLPCGGRAAIVARNQAYERAAKRADIKFVAIEDYRNFRDVGLRGLATDGAERPGARDRNGARNALFADLLIATGLRLEEASSLLAFEIEEAIRSNASAERQVAFRLPARLTKGDKGRTIRIPASLLARLRGYMEVERSLAVEKFKARGMATRMSGSQRCAVNGGKIELATKIGHAPLRLDVVTPEERRRLLIVNGDDNTVVGPAALWLSEIGLPMAPNSWEAVFARASRRCQAAGLAFNVSPHQLRHSFAVHMLALLIRQRFGEMREDQDIAGASYRRLLGDPLQQVQRLLGHASLATTYIYLDHLAGCQETVDAAVEELLSGIETPLPFGAAT